MKKLIFLFLLLPILCQAQKLEKNEVDEFTGKTIKITSWENLDVKKKFVSYYRIRQIEGNTTLNYKLMMTGKNVYSIAEDAKIMLKLENGEFINFSNLKHTISCRGCGAIGLKGSEAMGIEVNYIIEGNQIEELKKNKITKIRIYTSEGYVEGDVDDKTATTFMKSFQLID